MKRFDKCADTLRQQYELKHFVRYLINMLPVLSKFSRCKRLFPCSYYPILASPAQQLLNTIYYVGLLMP